MKAELEACIRGGTENGTRIPSMNLLQKYTENNNFKPISNSYHSTDFRIITSDKVKRKRQSWRPPLPVGAGACRFFLSKVQ